MWKLFYLLPLVLFACTKDSFAPGEVAERPHYLLIKPKVGEDLDALNAKTVACLRSRGAFRVGNVRFGHNNEAFLTVRRFNDERSGQRLLKELRKTSELRDYEMKVISQMNYRKLLKQRTYYAIY